MRDYVDFSKFNVKLMWLKTEPGHQHPRLNFHSTDYLDSVISGVFKRLFGFFFPSLSCVPTVTAGEKTLRRKTNGSISSRAADAGQTSGEMREICGRAAA